MSFLMNIMHSTSSFIPHKPSSLLFPPLNTFGCYAKTHLPAFHSIGFPLTSPNPSDRLQFSIGAATPSDQETFSAFHFEDLVEKDWSFLDTDDPNTDGEHMQKIDQIICAGEIEETSRILVSIGSEAFVDRVVYSTPCEQLLVVHDSLFILACIKEKYDQVKCWQGEVINVPDKWTPFDVVFLYFLPALPFELDQILVALAKHCLQGARVVISHPQGRQVVEEQRRQHPDVVVSNLPEKSTLQSAAADHSFEVVEFLDEPGFYLAVLRLNR
ncbi:hypothetical protein CDL12_20268 [Handroanthus impetiginosus]|uniref:Uncharacterized protein n=1 Tax=Handroanthus impetiginosus TaxID=429701 RepID=A0A2G9GPE7_9LAMI|nr:hypothetical protein CDL12_20268 [Handroanthus impetiginosus]